MTRVLQSREARQLRRYIRGAGHPVLCKNGSGARVTPGSIVLLSAPHDLTVLRWLPVRQPASAEPSNAAARPPARPGAHAPFFADSNGGTPAMSWRAPCQLPQCSPECAERVVGDQAIVGIRLRPEVSERLALEVMKGSGREGRGHGRLALRPTYRLEGWRVSVCGRQAGTGTMRSAYSTSDA